MRLRGMDDSSVSLVRIIYIISNIISAISSNDFLIIIIVIVTVITIISIIIMFQASSLNSSTVSVVSDDNGETELLPIRGTKVSRRKRQTRDVSCRKEYMLPCACNEKGNMLTICRLM